MSNTIAAPISDAPETKNQPATLRATAPDVAVSAENTAPAGDPPAATVSTVERIARHLEDGIVFGTLAPRERIQELKVAGDLGVSRGSVRELSLIHI